MCQPALLYRGWPTTWSYHLVCQSCGGFGEAYQAVWEDATLRSLTGCGVDIFHRNARYFFCPTCVRELATRSKRLQQKPVKSNLSAATKRLAIWETLITSVELPADLTRLLWQGVEDGYLSSSLLSKRQPVPSQFWKLLERLRVWLVPEVIAETLGLYADLSWEIQEHWLCQAAEEVVRRDWHRLEKDEENLSQASQRYQSSATDQREEGRLYQLLYGRETEKTQIHPEVRNYQLAQFQTLAVTIVTECLALVARPDCLWEEEDLLQEAFLATAEAIDSFDPNGEFTLPVWVEHAIRRHLMTSVSSTWKGVTADFIPSAKVYQRALEEASVTPATPWHHLLSNALTVEGPEAAFIEEEFRQCVRQAVDEADLGDWQRILVIRYWGLGDEPPRSLGYLAKQLDWSHDGVRNALRSALIELNELPIWSIAKTYRPDPGIKSRKDGVPGYVLAEQEIGDGLSQFWHEQTAEDRLGRLFGSSSLMTPEKEEQLQAAIRLQFEKLLFTTLQQLGLLEEVGGGQPDTLMEDRYRGIQEQLKAACQWTEDHIPTIITVVGRHMRGEGIHDEHQLLGDKEVVSVVAHLLTTGGWVSRHVFWQLKDRGYLGSQGELITLIRNCRKEICSSIEKQEEHTQLIHAVNHELNLQKGVSDVQP